MKDLYAVLSTLFLFAAIIVYSATGHTHISMGLFVAGVLYGGCYLIVAMKK